MLVRPDAAGVFQPHQVEAYYFGLTGNGHIGRINITNAFYWVVGTDSLNPIASRPVDVEEFNASIAETNNKSDTHFLAYSDVIGRMLRSVPGDAHLVADRCGGRISDGAAGDPRSRRRGRGRPEVLTRSPARSPARD